MSVLITTAGIAHWGELDAGTPDPPTNVFNTIILGQGNVSPLITDTSPLADAVSISAVTASPTLGGDGDPRNTGSDAAAYTWVFRLPGGATPIVASNVALATSSASGALAIHADEVTWTEPYRDNVIWFNLSAAGATMVTAFVDNPVEAARLRTSGPSANILHGGRGSQVMRPDHILTMVNRGEQVVLRARLYGLDDLELRPADVRSVTLTIYRRDAAAGVWTSHKKKALSRCLIELESQALSAKFPYRGGFNFEYVVSGRETQDGASRKFVYEVLLCDGSVQRITQEVRVTG